MRGALVAGALLAFGLSFDEIVVTNFTSSPDVQTLPLWIFGNLFRPNQAPVVNVVAAVLIVCRRCAGLARPAAQRRRRREQTVSSRRRMHMTVAQQRVLKTEIPGPRSKELHARKTAAVASGVGTTLPIYVTEAGGGIVVDADGNQLIDFGSGIAVTSVGNAAPRVVDAVQQQIAAFTHTCFMVTPYEGYVAVAEKLNELTPGTFEKRTALFNSGAEAVENAVKIARHYTGRQAVVAFDHAYHGRTNLTMALTAKNMPYKHRFGPFAGEIYRVPMAYPYRWPTGPENCADEAFDEFVSLVHTQVGESNCAAVLIEPIQGEGGFIVPAPGFLAKVADWCRENDILFIADEIQSGFCRTGDWFACEYEGVVPDLITTAKGIAGGMPLAGRHRPRRGDGRGAHRRSRRNVRRQPGRVRRGARRDRDDAGRGSRRCGQAHRGDDAAAARGAGRASTTSIGDVRGRGAMLALELVEPGTLDAECEAHRRDRRGLPPAGPDHADRRHVRQRAAFPAAAGDRRRPAAGGTRHPRGGVRRQGLVQTRTVSQAPQRGDVARVGAAASAEHAQVAEPPDDRPA